MTEDEDLVAIMFPKARPENMQQWVELAKAHKKIWVELSAGGDLGPTLFAERDGKLACGVISPLLDVEFAFRAAHTLKIGIHPDAMVLIVDARVARSKPGQSAEEFERTRPKNLQQACEEEGAYESGLVTDCIIVHYVTASSVQIAAVPYVRNGSVIEWQEAAVSEEVGGRVPEIVKTIMNLEPTIEEQILERLAAKMGLDDKAHEAYCKTRAAYQTLTKLGYIVWDFGDHDKSWEEFSAETTLQPQN